MPFSAQKIIFLPRPTNSSCGARKAHISFFTKINWLISARCRPNKHPHRQGRFSFSLSNWRTLCGCVSFSLALEGNSQAGSIKRRRWRKASLLRRDAVRPSRDHPILQVVLWLTFLHVCAVKSLYIMLMLLIGNLRTFPR